MRQGTTFSGVAFAFATNTEAKEDIITEWPGAGNQTKQKVLQRRPLCCLPRRVPQLIVNASLDSDRSLL